MNYYPGLFLSSDLHLASRYYLALQLEGEKEVGEKKYVLLLGYYDKKILKTEKLTLLKLMRFGGLYTLSPSNEVIGSSATRKTI